MSSKRAQELRTKVVRNGGLRALAYAVEQMQVTPTYFRQLMKGEKSASIKAAARFEKAVAKLKQIDGARIDRGDLCDACSKCPFYRTGSR